MKNNRNFYCQCLHEIENGLPRTKFCFLPCHDQRQILRERKEELETKNKKEKELRFKEEEKYFNQEDNCGEYTDDCT